MALTNKNTEYKCNSEKNNIKRLTNSYKEEADMLSELTENTISNMKNFLIMYSKNQLNKVIKLNNSLGKLEDELIKKALTSEELDITLLIRVVKVIQGSLDSSINMIKQISSDESYVDLINNSIESNNDIREKIPILQSQDSRDKVRSFIEEILENVKDINVSNNKGEVK